MIEELLVKYAEVALPVSAVILLAMVLGKPLTRRYGYGWRCLLWTLLAVRLLIPVSLTLPQAPVTLPVPEREIVYRRAEEPAHPEEREEVQISAPARPGEGFPSGAEPVPEMPDTALEPEKKISLLRVLGALWAVGAAVYLSFHLAGYFYLRHRVFQEARPVSDPDLNTIFQNACREQGLRRSVGFFCSRRVDTPLVIGLLRPAVVVPVLCCDGRELAMIFRHELTHCRRWDIARKFLLVLAGALHWYNPFVWWMIGQGGKDIELACDAAVVKGRGADFREAYSDALMTVLRQESGRRLLFSTRFSGGKEVLRQRFESILDMTVRRRGFLLVGAAVLAAALLGSLVACEGPEPGAEPGPSGPDASEEGPVPSEPDFRFSMKDLWEDESFTEIVRSIDGWPWDYEEKPPVPDESWKAVFDRDSYQIFPEIWDDRTDRYSEAWGGDRVTILKDPSSDFALMVHHYRYPRVREAGVMQYDDGWWTKIFKWQELGTDDLSRAEVIFGESVADLSFYLEEEQYAVMFQELQPHPLPVKGAEREMLQDLGMAVDVSGQGVLIYGRSRKDDTAFYYNLYYYSRTACRVQTLVKEGEGWPTVQELADDGFLILTGDDVNVYRPAEDGSAEKQPGPEELGMWAPLPEGWKRFVSGEVYSDPSRDIRAFFYCEYDRELLPRVTEGYCLTPAEWRMMILDNSGTPREDFAVGLPVWAGAEGPVGMIDATFRDGLLYFGHCVDDGPWNTDRYCLDLISPAHYLQRTRANISFYNDEDFLAEAEKMGYSGELLDWLRQQAFSREEVLSPGEGLLAMQSSPDGRYRFALREKDGRGILYLQDLAQEKNYALGWSETGVRYNFLGNEYFYYSAVGAIPRLYRTDAPEAPVETTEIGWVDIMGEAWSEEGDQAILYSSYPNDGGERCFSVAVLKGGEELAYRGDMKNEDGVEWYGLFVAQEIYFSEGRLCFSANPPEDRRYYCADIESGTIRYLTGEQFESARSAG